MALQIEIRCATERHWKIGTSGNRDIGTARLFFAGIANSSGRGTSADERGFETLGGVYRKPKISEDIAITLPVWRRDGR